MRTTSLALALLGALLLWKASHAAEEPSLLDKLSKAGVEIRKSFTATSKDAGDPASLSYENPDTGSDFYSVDIGVKTKSLFEKQLSGSTWNNGIAPTFEVHQSSKDTAKVKKAGVGITWESARDLPAKDTNGDEGRDADVDAFARMFYAETKLELNRDSELDQTTRTISFRLVYFDTLWEYGSGKFIPVVSRNFVMARWMPSLGIEHYRKLPIATKVGGETAIVADDVSTTQGFGRLNLLLIPLAVTLDQKFQLTATYTGRRHLSGDEFFGKTTRLFEGSADYYMDADRRFSIGLTYQNGRDPRRNFLDEEFSALGFKLKL